MNNNDLNERAKKSTAQEESEQFVWERLQNEALAAQRWRLEQEMEEAGKNPVAETGSWYSWAEVAAWPNRLVITALASFVIASLAVALCCVW